MQFDYILMIDHFHDVDFGLYIFEVVGVEEDFFIDYFDGNILIWLNGFAQIDGSIRAFSD